MAQGRLTAEELAEHLLERIAALDVGPSGLRSLLEVNPDALAQAAALDRERRLTGPRSPLHGIPVVLKDNLDTADRMHTGAGSLALADAYAAEDAEVVRRLRQAGAVILGKANMTEWANFMTEGMPSGYSSRGGQTLNPYGPSRWDVGGSSSGSAAAVAAGLATWAVGTETSGSILNPACQNALVGLKPTLGRVSRRGIVPLAHSQDTAGPLTRSVADAALALEAMAGEDPGDPITGAARGWPRDFRSSLRPDAVVGRRVGVPRGPYGEGLDAERRGMMDEVLAALRQAGVELVEGVEVEERPPSPWEVVLLHEFKADLNAYLGRLGPGAAVHSLREVVAFNAAHARETLRYGQTLLEAAERTSGTLTEPEYLSALVAQRQAARGAGVRGALARYGLEALVFPGDRGAAVAARAGDPSIAVPAGFTAEGEPFGVSFAAGPFQEPLLLGLAYAVEQRLHARRPPPLDGPLRDL